MSLIYRPHNEGNNTETHVIKKWCAKQTIALAGDFNLYLFDYEENNKVRDFVYLMFNFGIISTINKATRGKQHYATKVNFIHKNLVLNTKIQEQPFNRCS